jgi:hypothetical protein
LVIIGNSQQNELAANLQSVCHRRLHLALGFAGRGTRVGPRRPGFFCPIASHGGKRTLFLLRQTRYHLRAIRRLRNIKYVHVRQA